MGVRKALRPTGVREEGCSSAFLSISQHFSAFLGISQVVFLLRVDPVICGGVDCCLPRAGKRGWLHVL